MKQKTRGKFTARNSFWGMAGVPLFIIIMFAVLLSGISEATAASPLAYIANGTGNGVTVIDTSTNSIVTPSPIPVGIDPTGVAVSTAGTYANVVGTYVYVANQASDNVSVINTSTNSVVGATISVGLNPFGVAVNSAGTYVYVANVGGNTVSAIDTNAGAVNMTIPVGTYPYGVGINPAGTYVYVANSGDNNVSVINTSTNYAASNSFPPTIPVGTNPYGVAVSHSYAYVTNVTDGTVSVIDTSSNTVVGTPITVGSQPHGVAVNPTGTQVYVTNDGDNTVSIINTLSNTVVGSPVPVGHGPYGISVTSDGAFVYIANEGDSTISVIDTSTDSLSAVIPVSSGAVVFGSFLSVGTFSDVPPSYWAYSYIEAIYKDGITTGCQNGSIYLNCSTDGSDDVPRDQMAAFLIRALYGDNFNCTGLGVGVSGAAVDCSTTTPYFGDVTPATEPTFFPYIQKLYELGITIGCSQSPLLYCPSEVVTRDDMAAYIVRATQVQAGQQSPLPPPTCNAGPCSTTTPYFSDVTPVTEGSLFQDIQKLYELGITTGCPNPSNPSQPIYLSCPTDIVYRDQMAAFLSRAFLGLPK